MIFCEFKKLIGNKVLLLVVCAALLLNFLMMSIYTPAVSGSSNLTYAEYLGDIIETADLKHDEYLALGYTETSFVCMVQTAVSDTYSKLLDEPVELYSTPEWKYYFSYSGSAILIIICAFLCGFIILYQDRWNGTVTIIRTTKHGRFRLGICKLLCICLCAIMVTALFDLTELLFAIITEQPDNVNRFIQSVPGLERSPYLMTILAGILLKYIVHLSCFLFVASLAMFLTSVFNGYIPIYSLGLVVLGSQYLTATIPFLNSYHYFSVVNLYRIFQLDFLKSFSGVMILGRYAHAGRVLFTSLLAAVSILMYLSVFFFTVRRYKNGTGKMQMILKRIEAIRLQERIVGGRQVAHTSLTKHEIYKVYGKKMVLFIGIFACGLHFYQMSHYFAEDLSYEDHQYRKYMTELEGEPADEKEETIREKINYMTGIIDKELEMRIDYSVGKITSREYNEFQIEYYRCQDELPIMERVRDQYDRVVSLRENGQDAVLLYDTGWNLYFARGVDYYLIIGLILVLAGIFSSEIESEVLPILRTTLHGRGKLLQVKYFISALGCVLCLIFSESCAILLCKNNFYLPDAGAGICSINTALDVGDIPIYQYLLHINLLHLLGIVLLGFLIPSLSLLMRRTYAVMMIGTLVYLIRPVLGYFNIRLNITPDVLLSSPTIDLKLLFVWCAVTGALCAFSTMKYCRVRIL